MRSVCAACSFGADALDELEYVHEPVVYASGEKVLSKLVQEQWYLMVSMYHVLEKLEPGIVRNLRERYGIRWPHRYSLRTLIYQHLEVHSESPFVLLVSAAADTANAFLETDEYDFYLELQQNLDRDGMGIRVVECAGKSDLEEYTERIAEEAKGKPIPVTIIRTHAHKKHFELGYGDDGEVDTTDIKNGQLDALISAMDPKGSIILDGCGLGLKSGVAVAISKQYPQGYVYAPKTREAGIKSIDDTAQRLGSRSLAVTYADKEGNEHPARIFHNGRELKPIQ
jgi:hypothetical protein